MEVMGFEIERLHFLLWYLDSALVRSAIQPHIDGQASLRFGSGTETGMSKEE